MHRRISLTLLIVAGAFAGSGLPRHADAQAVYYRSIPIGERAIGLGGSFTGVANDPSATYYNPAGLVRGGRFGLLGSFTSVVFTRRTISDAFTAPDGEENFNSKTTTSLPRFVGTVVKVGPKKFSEDHQFAIGYSTVEVARGRLGIKITQNDAEASLDLRVNNNYSDRWYGVSFAAEVTRRSSVGFTIFLSDQSLSYTEDIGVANGGTFDPDTGVRINGDSATSSASVGASSYQFVPRLGWIHRMNPRWTVGLLLQTPGIPLKQKGNALRRITEASPTTEPIFSLFDEDDLKSRMPIPFEVRAGFGFQVKSDTLIAFDASLTGPVKNRPLFRDADALSPIDGELGTYIPATVGRRWTPNFSIGTEHVFDKFVVAGGLFTNISAARNVPATSSQYVEDQVNLWGASVSVGLDTKGYRLTVGATGMFGKGKAMSAVLDPQANAISYERTGATTGALIMYIAGAISIATKTAENVKARRDEKDTQAEEPDDTGKAEAPPPPATIRE